MKHIRNQEYNSMNVESLPMYETYTKENKQIKYIYDPYLFTVSALKKMESLLLFLENNNNKIKNVIPNKIESRALLTFDVYISISQEKWDSLKQQYYWTEHEWGQLYCACLYLAAYEKLHIPLFKEMYLKICENHAVGLVAQHLEYFGPNEISMGLSEKWSSWLEAYKTINEEVRHVKYVELFALQTWLSQFEQPILVVEEQGIFN